MAQPQPADYSLPGVMRYLQTEWQRNERDRIQWELERAEMKARIAKLEGEKRGLQLSLENHSKKLYILESSLRAKSGIEPSKDALESATHEFDDAIDVSAGPDLSPLIESRQYLEKCIQEVEYLLQSSSLEHPEPEPVTDLEPAPRRESLDRAQATEQSQLSAAVEPTQHHPQLEQRKVHSPERPRLLTRPPSSPKAAKTQSITVEPESESALTADPAEAGEGDSTVGQWHLEHTLAEHVEPVRVVEFVSASSLLTATDDGTVFLWDISKEPHIIHNYRGHQGVISSLAYSASTGIFYSAGQDRTIRYWNKNPGKSARNNVGMLVGHSDFIWALALHEQSGYLASSSSDGTVRLWDTSTHQHLSTLSKAEAHVPATCIQFIDNGKHILVGYEDNRLRSLDVQTGQTVLDFAFDELSDAKVPSVNAVAWSPVSNLVLSAHSDGIVRQFDPRTGECVRGLGAHRDSCVSLSVSPSGRGFVTGGEEGLVKIWSVETQSMVQQLQSHESVEGVLGVNWYSESTIATVGGDATAKIYRR